MPDVEIRIAAIDIRIREGARCAEVVPDRICRSIVNRMRKGIRCQHLEAVRQAPL